MIHLECDYDDNCICDDGCDDGVYDDDDNDDDDDDDDDDGRYTYTIITILNNISNYILIYRSECRVSRGTDMGQYAIKHF